VGHIGGDSADSIAVQGSIAYVAGNTHLWVVDISVPEKPVEIGKVDLGISGIATSVSGSLVCVLGSSKLVAVDVAVPSTPTVLSTTDTPPNTMDVFLSGTLAFVAAKESGLLVYYFVNPLVPKLIGSATTEGASANGVFVDGGVAYVADDKSGLEIFDVSIPDHPRFLGAYRGNLGFRDVCVGGKTAYVVGGDPTWFRSISVSFPEHPYPLGNVKLKCSGKKLAIDGNVAVVADSQWGDVVDITDPRKPIEKGYTRLLRASDLTVVGNTVISADRNGVMILDISSWSVRGFFDTKFTATSVLVSGTAALLGEELGLQTVDISDLSRPSRGDFYPWWWSSIQDNYVTGHMYRNGDSLFIGIREFGFLTVDISNPMEPILLANYREYLITGISGIGNLILVSTSDGRLLVISGSNPRTPILLGTYAAENRSFYCVTGHNSRAYLGEGNGLRIVDVSQPTHPSLLGVYERDVFSVRDLIQRDGLCYLLAYQTGGIGLHVVDVSLPQQPIWKAAYGLNDGYFGSISLSAPFVFVNIPMGYSYLTPVAGIFAFQVADPANPTVVGEYGMKQSYQNAGLYSESSNVFASGESGFYILRYTGPGAEPTPTPTISPTPNGSPSLTPTPTSTRTPTPTFTGIPGATPTPTETLQPCEPTSDLNGDGVVDAFDLAIFMSHWHGTP